METRFMQGTVSDGESLDTTNLLMDRLVELLCDSPSLCIQKSVAFFHTEDNLERGC